MSDTPNPADVIEAVEIQYRAPVPSLPDRWSPEQKAGYEAGWLDAMQRVKDSVDVAAAGLRVVQVPDGEGE